VSEGRKSSCDRKVEDPKKEEKEEQEERKDFKRKERTHVLDKIYAHVTAWKTKRGSMYGTFTRGTEKEGEGRKREPK